MKGFFMSVIRYLFGLSVLISCAPLLGIGASTRSTDCRGGALMDLKGPAEEGFRESFQVVAEPIRGLSFFERFIQRRKSPARSVDFDGPGGGGRPIARLHVGLAGGKAICTFNPLSGEGFLEHSEGDMRFENCRRGGIQASGSNSRAVAVGVGVSCVLGAVGLYHLFTKYNRKNCS